MLLGLSGVTAFSMLFCTLMSRLENSAAIETIFFVSFPDGYTVSDVVMYWREEPVVGVDKAELPQFTIVRWETNERKIRLATGMSQNQGQTIHCFIYFFLPH